MSTEATTMSRIEVLYPETPSLPWAHKTLETPRPNVDHLNHVGRINGNGEVYADESVIDEADTIRSLGLRANDLLYHATSSIALPAIAQHGALLSSQQLLDIQEPLTTGEITTNEGWHHLQSNGLPDVYASRSPTRTDYARTTDGYYPVVFGIDPQRLESQPTRDYGDGIRLGARVALGAVAAQIVPFKHISETKEWSRVNCRDDTVTMSLDAALLLTWGLGHRS